MLNNQVSILANKPDSGDEFQGRISNRKANFNECLVVLEVQGMDSEKEERKNKSSEERETDNQSFKSHHLLLSYIFVHCMGT